MANKDLQLDSHVVTYHGEIRRDMSISENPDGLLVYFTGGNSITITWPRIRAALKRKDK